MGRTISSVWCAAAGAIALATGCSQVEANALLSPEEKIHQATVTVAERCAGVVITGERHILTAAHCVRPGDEELAVKFQDGSRELAKVSTLDRDADLAVLSLPLPAKFAGLEISEALPSPGTAGYFAGRFDRGATIQEVNIVRVGWCPSLPNIPAALFTSLRGLPGDSGAPVVDRDLSIVGLVHGGARCSVAAPAHPARAMVRTVDDSAVAARGPRPRS